MKKCPSNKIYNPRSNRCIANNKTNVQKIIKERSEEYAKLQNKSKPAPKPVPKPIPKPKPAKKNNVCKINTKTKRCSNGLKTAPNARNLQ